MEPLLLTVQEAAEAISQSRSTVYMLMRSGALQSVSIGRARRIPRAAVEAYVAGLTGDVTPAAVAV